MSFKNCLLSKCQKSKFSEEKHKVCQNFDLLDLYYFEIVFTRAFDLTIIDRLAIRAKRNRLHSFEKI